MTHTILLIQSGPNPDTRTFTDFKSIRECIEGLCRLYEAHLKRRNPEAQCITYDVAQLYEFVDELADLGCLIYQESEGLYAAYNKSWIKDKIYTLLKQQAGGSDNGL